MELGTFSVSLAVEDMSASLDFYGKLGFTQIGGDGENWTIVANRSTVIGLFQGMFDANILTFNPGWSGPGEAAETFTDIRKLRAELQEAGLEIAADTTAESAEGPASFVLTDPDGNAILLDQHV